MRRTLEQSLSIDRVEMRSEHGDRRQVEAAIREHRKDNGKPPRHPSHRDAQVGLCVGQMKPRGRVDMHGRARFSCMKPSPVHLGQMPDQLSLATPGSPNDLLEAGQQRIIGQRLEAEH
jgi:hypothetical protein